MSNNSLYSDKNFMQEYSRIQKIINDSNYGTPYSEEISKLK